VPPRGLLAQDTEEPATVLEALPPATRLPAIPLGLLLNIRRFPAYAAPLRLFAKRLHSLRPEACAPDGRQIGLTACQLLQSLRFLSTTVDMTTTPQALPEVTPLHCFDAGSVASFDALLAEPSWVQGPTYALQRRRRLPAPKRGSFAPTSNSPDTSCHGPVSTPGGGARRRISGTESPRARRRTARGHPHKGCIAQSSAKKVGICAPEVPFIEGHPRRAGSATPQIVTNLWSIQMRRLFNRRDDLEALTCLRHRSTRRSGFRRSGPVERSQRPQ
jgi:hypothetical protein